MKKTTRNRERKRRGQKAGPEMPTLQLFNVLFNAVVGIWIVFVLFDKEEPKTWESNR